MINTIKKYLVKKIYKSLYRPGHYYSQIPDIKQIIDRKEKVFEIPEMIAGLDLNIQGQEEFLLSLKPYITEASFPYNSVSETRYYSHNSYFVESDALYYRAILKYSLPKRIIEVGSGFSSALLFDTVDSEGLNPEAVHFIEPFPDRLKKLFNEKDTKHYVLHQARVQDIEVDLFTSLNSGDILFIDSSHVSKIGSDVNFLFFKILPILKPGVLIHVHDILYPFEYPMGWVLEGRFWNEAYLLKSFLMFNPQFKILVFNDYLAKCQKSFLKEIDPRLLAGGGSIWIQKV